MSLLVGHVAIIPREGVRDPFEEATDSGDGHTGSTETGDPEAMDLSSYQQPMDLDHEEEEHDDDDEGNVSGVMH